MYMGDSFTTVFSVPMDLLHVIHVSELLRRVTVLGYEQCVHSLLLYWVMSSVYIRCYN